MEATVNTAGAGAWFACAIFMLHPLHVESVAWNSERKNLLSGFFYLLSINTFLHYRRFCGESANPVLTASGKKNMYWRLVNTVFICPVQQGGYL